MPANTTPPRPLIVKQLPLGLEYSLYVDQPENTFLELRQVHDVLIVNAIEINHLTEADGFLFQTKNFLPMVIKTADCLPIIIIGENQSSFIHAGHLGLRKGILKNEELKNIKPFYAFIGPHIKKCCFEVTKEFLPFGDEKNIIYSNNKIYIDLEKFAKEELFKLNPQIKIESLDTCTCCNKALHSFRKNKTPLRNYNFLMGRKLFD